MYDRLGLDPGKCSSENQCTNGTPYTGGVVEVVWLELMRGGFQAANPTYWMGFGWLKNKEIISKINWSFSFEVVEEDWLNVKVIITQ